MHRAIHTSPPPPHHRRFGLLLLLAVLGGGTAAGQWVHRTDVGSPGQRKGHALAYDSWRGVTVFFGGEIGGPGDETYYNDTWEYDGTHWQQITIADVKPDPRSGHAMCYDSVNHLVFLTGGINEDGYCSDFWAYRSDGPGHGSWLYRGRMGSFTENSDNGQAVAGHIMVFDEHRGLLVRMGGYGVITSAQVPNPEVVGKSRDVAYFDPNDPTDHYWKSAKNFDNYYQFEPTARLAGCYDPINQSILRYGGAWNNAVRENLGNQLHSFTLGIRTSITNINGTFWEYRNPDFFPGSFASSTDPGTQESAVVFDLVRDRVVVFGGQNDPDIPNPARADLTLEFYPIHYPYPNAAHEWYYSQPAIVPVTTKPPGRAGHAMIYDSQRHVTVMVGGASGSTRYDDTWELPSIPAQGDGWVDFSFSGGNFGSAQFPYATLAQAVNAASVAHRDLSLVGPRITSETVTIRNNMTLRAVGGPVTIGQP